MAKESAQFTVDPRIIYRVINDQASTVSKAVLEAVMNAIDARASGCWVDISKDGFVIEDDGDGFRSKEDIHEFFKQFGKPHEDEGNDVPFGRFRMGRGQIFAFAATRWNTGEYAMDVDVANKGLDFDIEDGKPHQPGCRIEGTFYEALTTRQYHDLVRHLPEEVAYIDIPVYYDGELINQPAAQVKWDHEDEHAYYKFESNKALKVYNMGAWVQQIPHAKYGIGGTVVSKNHLHLNTSRNMVLDGRCHEWAQIKKVLTKEMKKRHTGDSQKRKKLDLETRSRMLRELLDNEISLQEIKDEPVLMNAKGRGVNIRQLVRSDAPVAVVSPNAKAGVVDKVAQSTNALLLHNGLTKYFAAGAAVVDGVEFSRDMLDDPQQVGRLALELLEHVGRRDGDRVTESHANRTRRDQLVDYERLAEDFNTEREYLRDRDLGPHERASLKALRSIYSDVAATVVSAGNRENLLDSGAVQSIHRRKVIAGRAEDAHAWTDGQHFVAIDQRHLRKMYNMTFGMRDLVNSLVHECCHTEACYSGADPHDETFTQLVATVHEDYGQQLEKPVWKMVGRFLQTCEKENLRLPKHFATTLDRIEDYQQQAKRFEVDEDVEAIDQFVEDLNAAGSDFGCGHDHGPNHDDGAGTEAAADQPSQDNSAAERYTDTDEGLDGVAECEPETVDDALAEEDPADLFSPSPM